MFLSNNLETLLSFHHIPLCIESDGASRKDRLFSAHLPGFKAVEDGRRRFVLSRRSTPAEAVESLSADLQGLRIVSNDGHKDILMPRDLDPSTLVRKLTPKTEAETQALEYVIDVATRMVVTFNIMREKYDDLWIVSKGSSLIVSDREADMNQSFAITVLNYDPMTAVLDVSRHIDGQLLRRRDLEFRAPVIPNVKKTLLEQYHASKPLTQLRSESDEPVDI